LLLPPRVLTVTDFLPLATTDTCPLAAVKHRTLPIYGLQFHPEVTHTLRGAEIIQRFVREICACKPDWVMGDYIAEAVAKQDADVAAIKAACDARTALTCVTAAADCFGTGTRLERMFATTFSISPL